MEKLGILQNVICYCGGTAGAYIHDKPPTWGINLHSEKDFVIHGVCDCKATYWTGLAPAYMKDLLKSYLPARDLRSSKKKSTCHACFSNKNSYGCRAFFVAVKLLWESLPQHIRDAGSLDIFERQ